MTGVTRSTPATPPTRSARLPRVAIVVSLPPVTGGSHAPAVALVLVAAALNAAYLLVGCPAELSPDEAHYWQWSRHLDYCYYSKGPLVAWLIRGGCELFGGVSVAVTGNEAAAVRSPAVLCGAALLAGVYALAFRTTRSRNFALATVAAGLTVPAIPATGVLITIDSPLLACWVWATVLVHRAIFDGRPSNPSACEKGSTRDQWPWIAAGCVAAVGVLGKYTMLGFPGCVGLFLLANPAVRHHLRTPGFWAFAGLTAGGLLPILVWNATHEWVGLRHLFALAGGTRPVGKPTFDPLGPLAFVGGQAGLLLGYWFVVWAWAAVALRPGKTRDPVGPERLREGADTELKVTYLWWLSVPVWLVFAAASVRGTAEANWTAPAFVTGWVLGAVWLRTRLRDSRLFAGFFAFGILLGVAATVCGRYPVLVRPVLAAVCPAPTTDKPAPIRQLDPTTRLAGWTTLAATIDRLSEKIRREDGQDPVIAASNWSIPGELAFYSVGHPDTYSVGLALTDRHSQYDIWRPNPVADAQAFRGRTFVYVGYRMPAMERVFDRVEPPVGVIASDGGVPVAAWEVWVCRGFRGFLANDGRSTGAGY